MRPQHATLIRGLCIATLVFSALTILTYVVTLFTVGIGGSLWNEYGTDAITYSYNTHDNSLAGNMDVNGLTEDDLMGFGNFIWTLLSALSVWGLVTAVVTAVASIIGIIGAPDRDKLGRVFAWSIVGAVAAFLSASFITAVLFVIAAVFSRKDKNAPAFDPAAQPAYGQAVYAQGYVGYTQVPGGATYAQAGYQTGYAQPGAHNTYAAGYGAPQPPANAYERTYSTPQQPVNAFAAQQPVQQAAPVTQQPVQPQAAAPADGQTGAAAADAQAGAATDAADAAAGEQGKNA